MKSLKLSLFLFTLLATNYSIKDLHADEVDGLKPNIVFMLADDMGWNPYSLIAVTKSNSKLYR